MNTRLSCLFSILSVLSCTAQEATSKEAIKIELLNQQATQKVLKQAQNVCTGLAILGILGNALCYYTVNESPNAIFLEHGTLPLPKNFKHLVYYTAVYLGYYLPTTAFAGLVTYLFNSKYECSIKLLQEELDACSDTKE